MDISSLVCFILISCGSGLTINAPVWTTLEHHKRLMQDPSYPSVLAKLAPVHKGPISMSHFEMTEDPVRGLTAPETYFTYSTLKEGKTRDQINPFIAGTGSYVDVKMGFHSGWCMEKPNLLVAILGWASVEVSDVTMICVWLNQI